MLPRPFTLNLTELWKMITSFAWEVSVLVTTTGMLFNNFFKAFFKEGEDLNLEERFNSIFI